MNSTQLKELLPQLQTQKFAGKSDDDLLAYIRIYHSLYTMVSVNALQDEYGDTAVYRRKLSTLYNTLVRRYQKRTTLVEKAKILDALYCLLYATQPAPAPSRLQQFFTAAEELINSYLSTRPAVITRGEMTDEHSKKCGNTINSESKDSSVDRTPADDTEYYIMRLIMMQWYGYIDEGEEPADLKYVRTKMQEWSLTQSADGSWSDITTLQALRRIDILNLNADFTSDPSHNEVIKSAFTSYCVPPATSHYELIYDLTRDVTNIGTDIPRSLTHISQTLPNTLQASALKVETACHQITYDLQVEM